MINKLNGEIISPTDEQEMASLCPVISEILKLCESIKIVTKLMNTLNTSLTAITSTVDNKGKEFENNLHMHDISYKMLEVSNMV